jgi:hypothetical protein
MQEVDKEPHQEQDLELPEDQEEVVAELVLEDQGLEPKHTVTTSINKWI